jgi:pimeloyl-ACP methyl ester carboxylesterase
MRLANEFDIHANAMVSKVLLDSIISVVAVLVITGDTDQLMPAWNAKRLANALPQAKFSLIKECGHLPHEETPDEFLALVKDFFSQIVSTDAKTETSFAPT